MAEKKVKKILKLARKHPRNMMNLGSHKVTGVFAEYELNESEVAELSSKGGKHWFKEGKKEDLPQPKKKAPAKKEEK